MPSVITLGEDRFNQLMKRNKELEVDNLNLMDEISRLKEQLEDIKNAIHIIREFDIS